MMRKLHVNAMRKGSELVSIRGTPNKSPERCYGLVVRVPDHPARDPG